MSLRLYFQPHIGKAEKSENVNNSKSQERETKGAFGPNSLENSTQFEI